MSSRVHTLPAEGVTGAAGRGAGAGGLAKDRSLNQFMGGGVDHKKLLLKH